MGILMILILLIATVGAILPMFVKSKKWKNFFDAIKALLTGVFCVMLIGGILVGGFLVISDTYENKQIKSQETSVIETIDLVALSDNNLTNGNFFLGSGSVNNSTYYFYYSETEHGLKLNKLNADFDDVYIKYCSENDKPRIEKENAKTTYEYSLRNKPGFWNLDIYSYWYYYNYKNDDIVEEKEHEEIRYLIYVPEGSIKTDFTIDMQ